MNRLLSSGLLLLVAAALSSCAPSNRVSVGGVPKWLASGAQISAEPKPYRPDSAIIYHGNESGPIEFEVVTDRRTYPEPRVKKEKPIVTSGSLGDRGRDARIRRVVR